LELLEPLRQCEPTEDGEVGVEADALDATDAEHRQRVAML